MKITRRHLRRLIREELLRETSIAPAAVAAAEFLSAGTFMSRVPTTSSGMKQKGAYEIAKRVIGYISGPASAAKFAAFMAPVFLFINVVGVFMALPTIMSVYMRYLGTAEGTLASMSDILGRPLNSTDIAKKRSEWIPSFTGVEWNRQRIIDYLASSLDSQEGKVLLSKLTADEHRSSAGLMIDRPIISREFHAEILKRRPQLEAEGKKNLLAEIKRLTAEYSLTEEGKKKIIEFATSLGWSESEAEETAEETAEA
jgi:hypothetical protein